MSKYPTDKDADEDSPLEQDIQIDGPPPDAFYEDELQAMRRDSDLHKLRHRVTILAILIPCLLCAILVFAYLDVRERLSRFQTAGSREVQTLSEDIVNKATSLSDQYAKLEKTWAVIQDRVEKIEGDIKELDVSKVNKKTLEMANKKRSKDVAEAFAALNKDVSQHKASVEALAKELNQRLDDTLAELLTDLKAQKKELAKVVRSTEDMGKKAQEQESAIKRLSEGKVDKGALATLFENERVKMALLERKMKSLVEEVLWLEDRLKLSGKRTEALEAKVPDPKTGEPPVAETPDTLPTPEEGSIIEQEITQ